MGVKQKHSLGIRGPLGWRTCMTSGGKPYNIMYQILPSFLKTLHKKNAHYTLHVMGKFHGYSLFIFEPTLHAIIYISLISFFTVVALYPDLTQYEIRISESCNMYPKHCIIQQNLILSVFKKCNVGNQHFSFISRTNMCKKFLKLYFLLC